MASARAGGGAWGQRPTSDVTLTFPGYRSYSLLLLELGRVRLRQGFGEWIDVAAAPETVRVLDVTPAVAKELLHLPRSFHRDPADRLIVATARALDLMVLTEDGPIRESGLVRLWRR